MGVVYAGGDGDLIVLYTYLKGGCSRWGIVQSVRLAKTTNVSSPAIDPSPPCPPDLCEEKGGNGPGQRVKNGCL